jgi:4-amino-4-deoxy-L-arabinose transferase-like glycosyltransferase
MVLAAFLVRLALIVVLGTYHLNPARDHWRFGWEIGRVARSITLGQGFSSPYQGQTGPTAHFVPVYPYLLAGVFKLFGLYSDASALAIMALNSLFSALTCWSIFYLADKAFGRGVATVAAWLWVFHPLALYVSAKWVWETNLSALLLSLVFLAALHLRDAQRLSAWTGFGLLCGVAALTNPALVSVLPFTVAWCYRSRAKRSQALFLVAASALAFALCLAPWTLRNHRVFERFIPLRSNFWFEVYVGNNDKAIGKPVLDRHPSHNDDELAQYRRLGENAYFAEKKREALAYICTRPRRFAWLTLVRIATWWTGGWEIARRDWFGPWSTGLEFFGFTLQSCLGFLGLALALRNRNPAAPLFAIFVFAYPLVYYFLFAGRRYSHPLDPVMVVLAVYALQQAFYRKQSEQVLARPMAR